MMNALYSAATGMSAQQVSMDVISHNLANVNTTGFKSTRVAFEDLLYQELGSRDAQQRGAQVGMGVAPGTTQVQFRQGTLNASSDPASLAIEGDGFFKVSTPTGVAYTRDGSFRTDANGQLVTSSGYKLEPAMTLPAGADLNTLSVSSTGLVKVKVGNTIQQLGQLAITRFTNPSGLTAAGENLYMASANSGAAEDGVGGVGGRGFVRQGMLEGSTVSVMEEMINMISAQRAFESVAKVLSTSDEMLGIANAMRR